MWARMIAASPSTRQTPTAEDAPNWQAALRDAISSPAQLLEYLGIDPALPSLEYGPATGKQRKLKVSHSTPWATWMPRAATG